MKPYLWSLTLLALIILPYVKCSFLFILVLVEAGPSQILVCLHFDSMHALIYYAVFCSVTGKNEEQEQACPTIAGYHQRISDAGWWEDQRCSAGMATHHCEEMGCLPEEFYIGRFYRNWICLDWLDLDTTLKFLISLRLRRYSLFSFRLCAYWFTYSAIRESLGNWSMLGLAYCVKFLAILYPVSTCIDYGSTIIVFCGYRKYK